VPARYARPEASTGFLGQPERFEYVQPATKMPAAPAADAAPAANTGDDDVSAQ